MQDAFFIPNRWLGVVRLLFGFNHPLNNKKSCISLSYWLFQ